ncbi:homocitrate synthase [Clostridium sp. DJ247]|uniref:homocitrate synthase/isopropylmalate synthase family protein n=1 Tax=Clostridium sp. DJ247 TaxID=2726188 RepID=UPI001624E5A6|nr:homocitrate synthase [Clostridium sp. DJ247]MBC2582419.1 homocitrate synthase [Clostridium sp. DJ247]
MSIIVEGSKKLIIDRTLPEVAKNLKNVKKDHVFSFLKLLKQVGVDLIEIDKLTIDKVGKLPRTLEYIFRIKTCKDIALIDKYNFKYLVVDYERALSLSLEHVNKITNRNVILEINIEDLNNFLEHNYNKIINKLNIKCLRISNVNKYNLLTWKQLIENIKSRFLVTVDFCADNKYYMATAISIEACTDGADVITTAFNGENYGFAPLEEVVMALKIIKNGNVCGDLRLLGELSTVYKNLTKENIFCMKAILGEDIFKYESGIHVDGIEKNPITYEPYDPNDVGQKRKMFIGKHSGSRAVMVKLKELNISYTGIDMEALLQKIRVKSIQLKRNILDEELIQMSNSFN